MYDYKYKFVFIILSKITYKNCNVGELYEGKTTDWIMNQGVQLVANDISNWHGNWLLMGEWSLASPGSATFTDVTLKQYFDNMFNTLNAMHSG